MFVNVVQKVQKTAQVLMEQKEFGIEEEFKKPNPLKLTRGFYFVRDDIFYTGHSYFLLSIIPFIITEVTTTNVVVFQNVFLPFSFL